MKKIKKNIDLKELEKYGFEEENSRYVKYTNDTYYDNPITITVNRFTRIIEKCYAWKRMLGPIYHSSIVKNDKQVKPDKYIEDLIKAGYVEEI